MFNKDALIQKDKAHLLHPATSIADHQKNTPRIVTSAETVYIEDINGDKQLDAVGGLWCVNVGYGRKELADCMQTAAQQLAYYHSFSGASNPSEIQLASRLIKLTEGRMSKVFFGSSGSDANDTLIKIAWQYFHLKGQPQKRKIIARQQAYHGTSISTASLTGIESFHKGFGLPLPEVIRVSCPHFWRFAKPSQTEVEYTDQLIEEIDKTIQLNGAENIAAFIAEPIIAAGGVIPPPVGYFQKLKACLERYDILLICDEVVCGFGRLGHTFGADYYHIEADMMATAKGLTSGYFPLSAAFINDKIWQVLLSHADQMGNFAHGYTYSGHPVGCAVAMANLDIIERDQLIDYAAVQGAYLHQQLARLLNLPAVAEIRGVGLLAGIQLVSDKQQKTLCNPADQIPAKIAAACFKQGLIVRPLPSVSSLALSPPFTIVAEQIDFIIETLEKAISSVT